MTTDPLDIHHGPRKLRVATVSLAGCFGCHMSFLDIDERLFELIEHVEFDRSPFTDIKQVGRCDIGLQILDMVLLVESMGGPGNLREGRPREPHLLPKDRRLVGEAHRRLLGGESSLRRPKSGELRLLSRGEVRKSSRHGRRRRRGQRGHQEKRAIEKQERRRRQLVPTADHEPGERHQGPRKWRARVAA